MIDLKETETAFASTTVSCTKKTLGARKLKAEPKRANRKASSTGEASAAAQARAARTGRRIYSDEKRSQKLGQIGKSIGRGESVRNEVKRAGISEQTYYQWKKSAGPAVAPGELKDLLALEEENDRLKRLLAERLRKENAELKKKLGLA